jgi:hypothetical protein
MKSKGTTNEWFGINAMSESSRMLTDFNDGQFVKNMMQYALFGTVYRNQRPPAYMVQHLKRGLGFEENRPISSHYLADIVRRLEQVVDAASLRHLLKKDGTLKVFSRRQSVYDDAHVGIKVDARVPKSAYSSMTFRQGWAEVDYQPLYDLMNKLKPLSEMLTSHENAVRGERRYEATLKQLKDMEESMRQHLEDKERMQAEEREALAWVESKPASVVADVRTDNIWGLIGRRTWEDTQGQYERLKATYEERIAAHVPNNADIINAETLHAKVQDVVMKAYEWCITTAGGDEE